MQKQRLHKLHVRIAISAGGPVASRKHAPGLASRDGGQPGPAASSFSRRTRRSNIGLGLTMQ